MVVPISNWKVDHILHVGLQYVNVRHTKRFSVILLRFTGFFIDCVVPVLSLVFDVTIPHTFRDLNIAYRKTKFKSDGCFQLDYKYLL